MRSDSAVLNNGEETVLHGILVGVITPEQPEERVKEYLDELEFLAGTAGVQSVRRFTQRLDTPNPATYVGKGKLEEIADFLSGYKEQHEGRPLATVIFDDDLSASQAGKIEKALGCGVLDRSSLILYIFEKRARSAQARLQVELAQLEYTLPRLKRMWTHLERQRGGTGARGGAGEREIETDRRMIRARISALKEKLKEIEKQGRVQSRRRSRMIRVALVGYTNVGKTTLMNFLSGEKLFAENKLFATLDTTVRKVVLDRIPFLLSDTVGFIRKLPHDLVESFRTTLEEAREVDILVHVADLSHPNFEEQIAVVNRTLVELGACPPHTILAYNKIDAFRERQRKEQDPFFSEADMDALKKSWLSRNPHGESSSTVFISALTGENMAELKQVLQDKVKEMYLERYPYQAEEGSR